VVDAVVVADFDYAGARSVFVALGSGWLHFYNQPPRSTERNAINHIGLVVKGLDALAVAMEVSGVEPPKGVQRFPDGNCLTVQAPDRVLLELFEPNWDTCQPEDARLVRCCEMRPELCAVDGRANRVREANRSRSAQ